MYCARGFLEMKILGGVSGDCCGVEERLTGNKEVKNKETGC